MNALLLNSEEAELYSGLRGGMIVLWDIFNQKVKINLKGHSTQITSMTNFRKEKTECILASGSADGKIKLWDLKSKSAATNIKGHFSQIDSLSFSPNFIYLASGSQDGIVKLWDVRNTNKSLKEINEKEQRAINCIEFNTDNKLAFGGKDKMIRYYNLDKFGKIGQTTPDRLPVQKIAFDNGGKNILSATDESLKYWEINEQGMNLIDMFETGWNKLQSFKYIEGKAICVLGSFGNKISYYLLKYKELIQNPNLILRENPYMENIFEVKETEDSSVLDSTIKKKIMNGSEIDLNNINNIYEDNKNFVLEKEKIPKENNLLKDEIEKNNIDNNLGISKFINNNDINNVDISLTEINSSKIENINNKITSNDDNNQIVSENMLKSKINEIKENLKEKNNSEKNNIVDEQVDKLMLGDISNMSDLSDNKGDLTLGMIFGNNNKIDNDNNINNNINKNDNNDNKNNINKVDNNDIGEFNDFGEKDVDLFLGGQNKNLDISAIPSMIGDNDTNTLNDISMLSSIKKIYNSKNTLMSSTNDNNNKKLTLEDLSSTNKPQTSLNQNAASNLNDNKSFVTLKSNETLGIDITQLMEENGMLCNIVPQSHDLPILQEINSQHDNMRASITKRYNGLKIVTEWWKKSDIPSTLNALRILKDYSVVKDFFYYAIISREDITKIPLTLDSATVMLPYVYILMKSQVDEYWTTACRTGMTFLKIFMEKIEITMKSKKNAQGIGDKLLEEKIKKCEETVKLFRQIYESIFLRKHIKEGDNDKNNLAYAFYTDLQFFLKSYDDNNKIIINNI